MSAPTQPTVEELISRLRDTGNSAAACKVLVLDAADMLQSQSAKLSALEKDAARYRYFRSLWERIEWQHGSVEGYDVVNDDKTVASDCNWGDERIGRALDTAIDLARGKS